MIERPRPRARRACRTAPWRSRAWRRTAGRDPLRRDGRAHRRRTGSSALFFALVGAAQLAAGWRIYRDEADARLLKLVARRQRRDRAAVGLLADDRHARSGPSPARSPRSASATRSRRCSRSPSRRWPPWSCRAASSALAWLSGGIGIRLTFALLSLCADAGRARRARALTMARRYDGSPRRVGVIALAARRLRRRATPTSRAPPQAASSAKLRAELKGATQSQAGDFPADERPQPAAGRRRGRPDRARRSGSRASVFTVGDNRLAFGVIDQKSGFVYGKTAVYVADSPRREGARPVSRARPTCSSPIPPSAARPRPPRRTSSPRSTRRRSRSPARGSDVDPRRDEDRRQARRRADPARTSCRAARDQIPRPGERPPAITTDTVQSAERRHRVDRHAGAARRHARRRLRRRRSARSPSRCCSRRRRCAPRASAGRSSTSPPSSRPRYGDRVRVHPPGGLRRQRSQQGPARAAAPLQPEDRAVAVRLRSQRPRHRAAGGLVRLQRVRARAEVGAVAPAVRAPLRQDQRAVLPRRGASGSTSRCCASTSRSGARC